MRAARRSYAKAPASIAEARRFVTQLVREWGHEDLASDAALLVSEVVTNAINHANSAPIIDVIELDNGVRIEVADSSTTRPMQVGHDLTRPSGRGMQIVDSLSRAWGVKQRPVGKITWFELAS